MTATSRLDVNLSPNPFSTETTFDLDLSVDAEVVVDMCNVADRRADTRSLGA